VDGGFIDYLDFEIDEPEKYRRNVRLFGAVCGAKQVAEHISAEGVELFDFVDWMAELGLVGASYPRGTDNFFVSKHAGLVNEFVRRMSLGELDKVDKLFGYSKNAIAYYRENQDDWFLAELRSSNMMLARFYKPMSKEEEEKYALMMAGKHYTFDPLAFEEDAELCQKIVEGTLEFADRVGSPELKEIVADTFYVNMLYNISTDALCAFQWEVRNCSKEGLQEFVKRAEAELTKRFRERLSHYARLMEDYLAARGYRITMDDAVDYFIYQYIMASLEVEVDERRIALNNKEF